MFGDGENGLCLEGSIVMVDHDTIIVLSSMLLGLVNIILWSMTDSVVFLSFSVVCFLLEVMPSSWYMRGAIDG